MTSANVEIHRNGHEAFNARDFEAMTRHYADTISWTDHAQGRTFRTPGEFRADFLPGWVTASSDIRITDPRYLDAGDAVVSLFTVTGTHDGPLGTSPATGRRFAWSCASCGTSTWPAGSWVGICTTTSSRSSRSWA